MSKSKKTHTTKRIQLSANQTKPVNFTMSSKGAILYKKKINMDNMPSTFSQGIEISSVSKVKNLSAIARKKAEEEAAALAR